VYDIQRHLAEQVYYHYDPSTTTVSAWEPYVKNLPRTSDTTMAAASCRVDRQ